MRPALTSLLPGALGRLIERMRSRGFAGPTTKFFSRLAVALLTSCSLSRLLTANLGTHGRLLHTLAMGVQWNSLEFMF